MLGTSSPGRWLGEDAVDSPRPPRSPTPVRASRTFSRPRRGRCRPLTSASAPRRRPRSRPGTPTPRRRAPRPRPPHARPGHPATAPAVELCAAAPRSVFAPAARAGRAPGPSAAIWKGRHLADTCNRCARQETIQARQSLSGYSAAVRMKEGDGRSVPSGIIHNWVCVPVIRMRLLPPVLCAGQPAEERRQLQWD